MHGKRVGMERPAWSCSCLVIKATRGQRWRCQKKEGEEHRMQERAPSPQDWGVPGSALGRSESCPRKPTWKEGEGVGLAGGQWSR